MIVRITRVKVGHRQALIVQNPSTACAARGFCFGGFKIDFGAVAVGDMLSAVEPPGSALLGGSLFVRATKSNQKARRLAAGWANLALLDVWALLVSVRGGRGASLLRQVSECGCLANPHF